jgi:hypothetical protein
MFDLGHEGRFGPVRRMSAYPLEAAAFQERDRKTKGCSGMVDCHAHNLRRNAPTRGTTSQLQCPTI